LNRASRAAASGLGQARPILPRASRL
jgi:hypothetical protein